MGLALVVDDFQWAVHPGSVVSGPAERGRLVVLDQGTLGGPLEFENHGVPKVVTSVQ